MQFAIFALIFSFWTLLRVKGLKTATWFNITLCDSMVHFIPGVKGIIF